MKLNLLLFILLTASCSSNSLRGVAQDQDNLSNENRAKNFVSNNIDDAQKFNENYIFKFFQDLDNLARAQALTMLFDYKIKLIKKEEDLEKIMHSRLFCKLQKTRPLYEFVTDKIIDKLSDKNSFQFLIKAYNYYRKTTPLNEIALGNFAKTIIENEIEICGQKNCAQYPLTNTDGLNFNIMSDIDVFNYKEFFVSRTDYKTKVNESDFLPGDCIEKLGDGRVPNSEGFDWNRDHWIRSNTKDGEFVVTYDDGPHNSYTRQIMNLWNNSGEVKPGLFMLAKNASALSGLAQTAHKEGFFVASHSYSHCDLGNLAKASSWHNMSSLNRRCFSNVKGNAESNFSSWKSERLNYEIIQAIQDTQAVINKVDPNFKIKHFRLPFGSGVKNNLIGDRLYKEKVGHYFWKVDSLDWQDKNPYSVLNRVKQQMKSGRRGLILFHDIQKGTIEVTKLLIDEVKKNPNWKFVPLSQMEHH